MEKSCEINFPHFIVRFCFTSGTFEKVTYQLNTMEAGKSLYSFHFLKFFWQFNWKCYQIFQNQCIYLFDGAPFQWTSTRPTAAFYLLLWNQFCTRLLTRACAKDSCLFRTCKSRSQRIPKLKLVGLFSALEPVVHEDCTCILHIYLLNFACASHVLNWFHSRKPVEWNNRKSNLCLFRPSFQTNF